MLRVATNVTTGNIMAYSLAAAATATGLNKTMILRAIKTGKISGARDKSGEWCVEAAELHQSPQLMMKRQPICKYLASDQTQTLKNATVIKSHGRS